MTRGNCLAAEAGVEPVEDLPLLGGVCPDNEDIRTSSPHSLGIRGMAAYAYHARVLGNDDEVDAFFVKALAALATESVDVCASTLGGRRGQTP